MGEPVEIVGEGALSATEFTMQGRAYDKKGALVFDRSDGIPHVFSRIDQAAKSTLIEL
jgi:hypothetical protein